MCMWFCFHVTFVTWTQKELYKLGGWFAEILDTKLSVVCSFFIKEPLVKLWVGGQSVDRMGGRFIHFLNKRCASFDVFYLASAAYNDE